MDVEILALKEKKIVWFMCTNDYFFKLEPKKNSVVQNFSAFQKRLKVIIKADNFAFEFFIPQRSLQTCERVWILSEHLLFWTYVGEFLSKFYVTTSHL